MNTATLGAAVNLLAAVAVAAEEISSLIQEASSSGRTTLTDAEWSSITASADKAHQALEAALAGSTALSGSTGAAPGTTSTSSSTPAA